MTTIQGILLESALRAAVLLALVSVATPLLLRRSSSARRHFVWTGALMAALGIPLLSVTLPRWDVLPVAAGPAFLAPPTALPSMVEATIHPANESSIVSSAPQTVTAPAVVAPVASPIDWRAAIVIVWAVGAGVMLVPIVIGRLALLPLARSSCVFLRLGDQDVPVWLSATCRMPMTFGILVRRIVLPEDAESWPNDRLDAVLGHELAHVHRRDCLWRTLGQLARAAHWFNPLAWHAYRRLLIESENACDDAVLQRGTPSSDYADHLLSIATNHRSDALLSAAAIAMARPSTLEGRLLAIFDAARNRQRMTLLAAGVAVALIAGIAFPIAMIHAQSAPASAPVGDAQRAGKISQQFIADLEKADFASATASFDDTMKRALTSDQLGDLWQQLGAKFGNYLGHDESATEHFGDFFIVYIPCRWKNGAIDWRIVFDKNAKISGLWTVAPGDRLNKPATTETSAPKAEADRAVDVPQRVKLAVETISTCAETDPRVNPMLDSIKDIPSRVLANELVLYLKSDIDGIRRAAIFVFYRIEPADITPAVEQMIVLCKHSEDETRGMAALALGRQTVGEAYQSLCDMAEKDKSAFARRCAAYALGLAGNSEAIPLLKKIAANDPERLVKNNAQAAITMLTNPATTKPVGVPSGSASQKANLSAARVVVDVQGNLMCDGKLVDWANLADSLKIKSNLAETYLEIAVVADERVTLGRYRDARRQALARGRQLVEQLKMAYVSDAGDATPEERALLNRLAQAGLKDGKDIASHPPDARRAKLQEWVENFFAHNYRDITARKTIAWGEPEQSPDGNWSIRYQYAATIWDKDRITQNKVFTFTAAGKFVSVKEVKP